MLISYNNTTKVVLATPVGRGAVATILVTGSQATEQVASCFRAASGKPLETSPIGRIVFGRWFDGTSASEELVICRRSPTLIEINCHGGSLAAKRIMESLADAGLETVDWRDWTQQSEDDPLSAEAIVALASARTTRVASVLLDQQRGALRSAIEEIIALLNDERVLDATERLRELDSYAEFGMHLIDPWHVTLSGNTNVGKSSLINAILGYQRSIVFDEPGTTRDIVTAHTAIDGWPVQLADTAGLRRSDDLVEAAGVARARDHSAKADVIVKVFDASQPWSADDRILLRTSGKSIIVHNKCDLPTMMEDRPAGLLTSAKTGQGVEPLIDEIARQLTGCAPPLGLAVPFRPSHVEAIRDALDLVDDQSTWPKAITRLRDLAPELSRSIGPNSQ